jgi:hypothetical protein
MILPRTILPAYDGHCTPATASSSIDDPHHRVTAAARYENTNGGEDSALKYSAVYSGAGDVEAGGGGGPVAEGFTPEDKAILRKSSIREMSAPPADPMVRSNNRYHMKSQLITQSRRIIS